MKGYGWFLLTMAALLLLFPLPALSSAQKGSPVDTPPDTAVTTPTTPAVSDDEPAEEAVFRLLCGEEVVTLTEEDFLIRTLAMEMGPSYHEEAL